MGGGGLPETTPPGVLVIGRNARKDRTVIELGPGRYFGEPIRTRTIGDFAITTTRYRGGEVIPTHSHTHRYLFVPLEGALLERAIHRDHECSRGELVFNEAGEAHRDRVLGRGAAGLNIEIPSHWLEEFGDRIARLHPVVYGSAGPAIWAIGAIQIAMLRNDALQALSVEEAIVSLLDALRPAPAPDRSRAMLQAVEHAIRDRDAHPLRLAPIARSVGVHPSHLCRSFRHHHGCTISQYAARVRADRALVDILGTPDTLALVATRNGFADQAHLTRNIRSHYGATPGRLRAAARA